MKVWVLLTLCFSLLTNGYSEEYLAYAYSEPRIEKIYVSPDQILLLPEGIFYINKMEEAVPVHLLVSDDTGMYVVMTVYR